MAVGQQPAPAAVPRGSVLARMLFGSYALLAVSAALYPFAGWTHPGTPALAFLWTPWPRYVSAFDLAANVVGYVPLGALGVAALYPVLTGRSAAFAALAASSALSLALEATQTFLPVRIASNLDLLCNSAGAALGAIFGARFAGPLLGGGALRRWRASVAREGAVADLGLVLLALWLVTQANPATLLFAAGDLRDALAATGGPGYRPGLFVSIEALAAAANLIAVALLISALLRPDQPVAAFVGAFLCVALCVKTAAFALLTQAENALTWLTPGAQIGLAAGALLAWAAFALPRTARLALAAVLIMAATVLVNLAPPNPYLGAILKVWRQGYFLNLNGLTRAVSALWPFAAVGYLIWLAARREREPLG